MQYFWENTGWESKDPHLSKMASMPFQRPFPFIPQKPGLYIVRGPRQVGKSSWLKTVLSHYAKKEKSFYLSCENVRDNRELAEILKSLRDRKLVLLDEVSFVRGWDRAVKHEIDSGLHYILMITGSHAYDLKQGADRMPGRFETGGEFHLLPMSFDEFRRVRVQAGWAKADPVDEFIAYFKSGGFPSAVAEAGPNSKVPRKAMSTYWKWLAGDIVKLGKQENYLEELMIQFAVCMQTPLSFQTLAKKTRIGSHNTVQEYASALESCFALKQLLAVDPDTGAFRFKKERKFYFTDPLLYWIALDLSGRKVPENYEEKIAEMVAHEELSRKHRRFGFVHNRSGEVDFVLPTRWAIELKWSEVAMNISKAYYNLNVPFKTIWTKANFLSEQP